MWESERGCFAERAYQDHVELDTIGAVYITNCILALPRDNKVISLGQVNPRSHSLLLLSLH